MKTVVPIIKLTESAGKSSPIEKTLLISSHPHKNDILTKILLKAIDNQMNA